MHVRGNPKIRHSHLNYPKKKTLNLSLTVNYHSEHLKLLVKPAGTTAKKYLVVKAMTLASDQFTKDMFGQIN